MKCLKLLVKEHMALSGKHVIEVRYFTNHPVKWTNFTKKCSFLAVRIAIILETGEIVAIKKFKDSEDNDDVKRTTMRNEF